MKKQEEVIALVVDDMKVARLRMKAVCQMCGIKRIVEAANGKEAWNYMATQNLIPTIILSDYNMPDMNGLDFLALVRKSDSTKDVPVLFVTAEAEKNFITKAVVTGVTEVVIKPYSDKTLSDKIKHIMANV